MSNSITALSGGSEKVYIGGREAALRRGSAMRCGPTPFIKKKKLRDQIDDMHAFKSSATLPGGSHLLPFFPTLDLKS